MSQPLKYARQIAYSSEDTLAFSYEMGLKFKDAIGCYCETGTAAGAQVIAMAHAAPRKKIYAFDSYIGIPYPSNRDNQMPGLKMLTEYERTNLPDPGKQILETTGATSVSEESFWSHIRAALGDNHNIETVPGWFEETIPVFAAKIDTISILRLDGDLFNSTWVALHNLFPKCHRGACVIIDDWELPGCQAAVREYFELIGYEPEYHQVSNIRYLYK